MKILIVSTPPGEAPENIRAAWVGLTLSASHATPFTIETAGVLSMPKTRLGLWFARLRGKLEVQTGYIVHARDAVDILAQHSPEAATWWRENASRAIQPGQYFLFHAEVCQKVTK